MVLIVSYNRKTSWTKEAPTHIKDGLVVDGKLKKGVKQNVVKLGSIAKLNFSNLSSRKKRGKRRGVVD